MTAERNGCFPTAGRRIAWGGMLLVGLVTALACQESRPSIPLSDLPADPEEAAQVIFEQRCARCHGASGGGDGPDAVELWKSPPSFRDPDWQASVTDERIEKAIVRGGEAVGLSRWMPAYPELAGETEVVAALRRQIRAYHRSPAGRSGEESETERRAPADRREERASGP